MGKSNKYAKAAGGAVLAARLNVDEKAKTETLFIGSPIRMFEYDDKSPMQTRRICTLFRISDANLKKFVQSAKEKKGEFVFVTL